MGDNDDDDDDDYNDSDDVWVTVNDMQCFIGTDDSCLDSRR